MYFHIINVLAFQVWLKPTGAFSEMVLCLEFFLPLCVVVVVGWGWEVGWGMGDRFCFPKNFPRKYTGDCWVFRGQWKRARQFQGLSSNLKGRLPFRLHYFSGRRGGLVFFLPPLGFPSRLPSLTCDPTKIHIFPPEMMNTQKATATVFSHKCGFGNCNTGRRSRSLTLSPTSGPQETLKFQQI